MSISPIRVVVADDHPLMLGAVTTRLSVEPDIDVVATAESCAGLVAAVAEHRPDVAVVDQIMGDGSTLDVLAELAAASPTTRVVLLSATAYSADVAAAMEGGAAGFLAKTVSADDMPRHVRAAAAGDTVLDATSAAAIAAALRRPIGHVGITLSDRERDILRLVASGMTNGEIAAQIHVSLSTVKTHLERAFGKLGVTDRAAAVAQAKDRDLL